MTRIGLIERKTGETEVKVSLALDGHGAGERDTGVGFFDHMLDLLARHGHLDLGVEARGDLKTGAHHTVEDVGICIGQALDEALGDRAGIARYGQATIPMDEARAPARSTSPDAGCARSRLRSRRARSATSITSSSRSSCARWRSTRS